MTAEFPGTDRCPKCGAAVRFGDPWCTLCYTDLRPPGTASSAPEPEPEPEPTPLEPPSAYAPVVMASPDPLTAPLAAVEGPSWPCGACGTVNPMARDTCLGCGMHFLAGLRQEEPLLELPVVGDITRLSRAHLLALAFGVVVAFVVLTFLLGVIFR